MAADWPDEQELRAFEARWNDHPGMRHMGAHVDLSTPGLVRCTVASMTA